MRRIIPLVAVVWAVSVTLVTAMDQGGAPQAKGGAQQANRPEPTARAVWDHLQAADYRTWKMWPGREAFYPGTQPHGALLRTYLNQQAYEAVSTHVGRMPRGAIVVKENYEPDRTLSSITVMYKAAPGYDPAHNDWFWMKRLADGTVAAEGQVASCQNCHRQGVDYTRTGGLGGE